MDKESAHSGKSYLTGTSKVIPLGEKRIHLNIEGSGIYVSDTGDGFLNNASMYFGGTLHAVEGVVEESGFLVFSPVDGDKIYATWVGVGHLGKDGKGIFTYVGGTGKYAGISGGGEYTRVHVQNPSENIWAVTTIHKGRWKIP